MPLHVAFLWHMHQPDYVDAVHRVAMMPWVRLHATKGYLDMIWLVEQVPAFRCAFNITPVLIKQIQQLARGEVRDLWHELAVTPADQLTVDQRAGLLEHYFKANWHHMVKPHSRYWWLLQKRGTHPAPDDLARIARDFTAAELRDLQVWFHLAWFGYAAQRLYPDIAELKRKGRDFTEDDKKIVWARQQETLQSVLGFYRRAAERGQVELTTTPFYHPIMPLVYNTEFARRCMPGRQLPPQFSWPDDVRHHLEKARQQHVETFGAPPAGLWPSEGSVCPELIPMLQELGFEWFATDEGILWRSLEGHNGNGRDALFQGYRVQVDGHHITAVFRDRNISDFIGFNAAHNSAQQAAEFVVRQLENIQRHTPAAEPLCPVVLDGENAWENFADGGEGFLKELYQRIAGHQDLQPVTFASYFHSHPATETLTSLHTGSWINSDFDIWIGEPEENDAWTLLGRARKFLDDAARNRSASPEQLARAMDELAAAEGSDWFWWYGGDFVTNNDVIFDALFRRHLENAYVILGIQPPDILRVPICRVAMPAQRLLEPTDLVTPVIDGRKTSYYEWMGAGAYRATIDLTTMYRGELLIEQVFFGFDLQQLYVRCDFMERAVIPNNLVIRIHVEGRNRHVLTVHLEDRKMVSGHLQRVMDTGIESDCDDTIAREVRAASDQIIEMGFPFAIIGAQPGDTVNFHVQVMEGDTERERHPVDGAIRVEVPDQLYAAMRWSA
jgi:alpha-amylase/alpha-mannosidase (GH57 family)